MVVMLKYDFSIRTREGQRIASIVIAGRDRTDAERKLTQMYRYCTILRCDVRSGDGKPAPAHSRLSEEALTLLAAK